MESDHLYIVMELAEGVSLQDYMTAMRESNRVMSEDDVWQILSAVMLALDYIHNTHKIIHRWVTGGGGVAWVAWVARTVIWLVVYSIQLHIHPPIPATPSGTLPPRTSCWAAAPTCWAAPR